MTMFHHDNRDYNEAASEAAKRMLEMLTARIDKGRNHGAEIIKRIDREVPNDRILPAAALTIIPDKDSPSGFGVEIPGAQEILGKFALGQVAEIGKVPRSYVTSLLGRNDWGRELAAKNLNETLRHTEQKQLTRSVEGTMKGVLSTAYRRYDARMVLQYFLNAAQTLGALPYEAHLSETKMMVKVIMARVFEPVKNEIISVGAVYESSMFGNGAEVVSAFFERIWCTNLAIMDTQLRKVHLGARITSENMAWSQEVIDQDTKTLGLMTQEMVGNLLGPGSVNTLMAAIKAADEEKITGREVEAFLKKRLNVGEVEEVKKIFTSADIENLPPGQTPWRLSNALSFYAKEVEDSEVRFDIQKLAGEVLRPFAVVA